MFCRTGCKFRQTVVCLLPKEGGAAMPIHESQLRYMEYIHRENDDRHHTDSEDAYQYDLLRL